MPTETRTVRPGPTNRSVLTEDGRALTAPATWSLLAPGDAGLTRRVKAAGPTWTVTEKVGRRTFSRGVWADSAAIEKARGDLDAERKDPAYARKLDAARGRRAVKQEEYVGDFRGTVLAFLAFDPSREALAQKLADAVTAHATPVGSGTVARTERIPIDERAEAAVIAWMRHQTTAYDDLVIPRVKGERRRVRRMLAERSRMLLDRYRSGVERNDAQCPLQRALAGRLGRRAGSAAAPRLHAVYHRNQETVHHGGAEARRQRMLEKEELTEKVIGAAIEVHRALGPGLLESAYEECLCHELGLLGLPFERQIELPLRYKEVELSVGYRVDVIVERSLLLELKAIERVPIHEAQLLTYLRLTGVRVGLILNFNVAAMRHGITRRVV